MLSFYHAAAKSLGVAGALHRTGNALLALSILVMMNACSASSGLLVSLDVDKSVLPQGRVVVRASMSNKSEEGVTFLPWNTPFESQITGPGFIVIRSDSGEEVPYVGPMVKRRAPSSADYVTLDVGQVLTNSVDITQAFEFCADVSYEIKPKPHLFDADYQDVSFFSDAVVISLGSAFEPCG